MISQSDELCFWPRMFLYCLLMVLTLGSEANSQDCLNSLGYHFGRAVAKKTHRPEYESEKTPTKHKIMCCGTLPKKSGADAGSMQHEPLTASSKHTCTQQVDQSAAQHNKSKPSRAQPSQGKQSRSSAKPSQAKHASKKYKTHPAKNAVNQIGL